MYKIWIHFWFRGIQWYYILSCGCDDKEETVCMSQHNLPKKVYNREAREVTLVVVSNSSSSEL